MDRPQLQAMFDYVREGDTVYIHDFSRLARSTKDLLEIVERFTEQGRASGQQQREPRHRNPYRKADVDHDCSHQ